jgi:hypothetical protein
MSIFFPRIARAAVADGDDEMRVTYEVFRLMAPLPFAAQLRIMRHVGEIFEERHQYKFTGDDAGNGLG